MKRALIDGGFAKEAQRDLIGAFIFRSKRDSRRQRNLSANDRVSAEKVHVRIEQMH